MFTKRELELQKKQTLEQYIDLVFKEAKRRLAEKKIHEVCTNHLRKIRNQDNFEDDVRNVFYDSIDHAR